MSKGEEKLLTILRREIKTGQVKNIKREVIFQGLNYKDSPLRYDIAFESPKGLVLCEFDGPQHYEYNKFFHKKYSTFRHMQANDRRKNEYALKHNIPLFRIPYYDLDNINSLKDILRPQYKVKTKYHNDDLIIELKNKD